MTETVIEIKFRLGIENRFSILSARIMFDN